MKKKSFLKLFRIALVLLALLVLMWYLNPFCIFDEDCFECEDFEHFKKATEIIQKVEFFHEEKGVLPDCLEDIGENTTMKGPFYTKIDQKGYTVWFGTFLGESCTYHSDTKTWTPY